MFMSGQQLKALFFCVVSVGVLFLPFEFPGKWIGLFSFLFIGVPWYLIATKRAMENRIATTGGKRAFSPTLLLLGLFLTITGVAIDILIIQELITNPSFEVVSTLMFRIIMGVSFFGAGVYILYLSVGIRKEEI